MISKRMRVYNGIWPLSSDINGQMLGFKTGAFSFTRRCDPLTHGKDKRKRKKKTKHGEKAKASVKIES
jgi:ribosomal protein S19